jgi:hypothetical protein
LWPSRDVYYKNTTDNDFGQRKRNMFVRDRPCLNVEKTKIKAWQTIKTCYLCEIDLKSVHRSKCGYLGPGKILNGREYRCKINIIVFLINLLFVIWIGLVRFGDWFSDRSSNFNIRNIYVFIEIVFGEFLQFFVFLTWNMKFKWHSFVRMIYFKKLLIILYCYHQL